jgi:hypothetical protein
MDEEPRDKLLELCYKLGGEGEPISVYTDDPLLRENTLLCDFTLSKKVDMELKIERADRVFRDFESSAVRSGILPIRNYDDVQHRFEGFQDFWISADTNIFLSCIFTRHIVPRLTQTNPDFWLLVILPKICLIELEMMANNEKNGILTPIGRAGKRTIQEIMEIRSKVVNTNLLITGTISESTRILKNNVLKDLMIRQQAIEFYSKINVFGGMFFMTSDKTQALFAEAEGIPTLFVEQPHLKESTLDFSYRKLSKLLYELAVQFGGITMENPKKRIALKGIWSAKSIDDWINSEVRIEGGEQ